MGQLRVEVLGRPAVIHDGAPLTLSAKAVASVTTVVASASVAIRSDTRSTGIRQ
jgi:hypothetical protein